MKKLLSPVNKKVIIVTSLFMGIILLAGILLYFSPEQLVGKAHESEESICALRPQDHVGK